MPEPGDEESEFLERAVRNVLHPAAVIRANYTIVAANPRYAKLFRKSGEAMIGRHCYEASHGYTRPCSEMGEHCPIAVAQAERHWAETVHAHFTGEGKELESVIVHPIEEPSGAVSGFLEIIYPFESDRKQQRTPLIGHSPAFTRMMDLVERVARSEIPALLLGESGTGKELIAAEIHRRSRRRQRPFVPVDCSGLAETLFESELFGHERGAFTGATQPKKGLVEAATGGTLFLDEIGDVPLAQQVKLLRLLETGLYRRVGSVELRKSDFRLICATHRDLRGMVQRGEFRRDLYHRINAFPVEAAPLRARAEDLALIADSLLRRVDPEKPRRLSREALRALQQHPFPGNVRELLNVLQRACLLTDAPVIEVENLPDEFRGAGAREPGAAEPAGTPFPTEIIPLEQLESHYLRSVASRFVGERRELARRLGISERSLYRKLAECSLVRSRSRAAEGPSDPSADGASGQGRLCSPPAQATPVATPAANVSSFRRAISV